MEVTIKGGAEEIAALVLAVQERRGIQDPTGDLAEAIRGTLLEVAGQSEKRMQPVQA